MEDSQEGRDLKWGSEKRSYTPDPHPPGLWQTVGMGRLSADHLLPTSPHFSLFPIFSFSVSPPFSFSAPTLLWRLQPPPPLLEGQTSILAGKDCTIHACHVSCVAVSSRALYTPFTAAFFSFSALFCSSHFFNSPYSNLSRSLSSFYTLFGGLWFAFPLFLVAPVFLYSPCCLQPAAFFPFLFAVTPFFPPPLLCKISDPSSAAFFEGAPMVLLTSVKSLISHQLFSTCGIYVCSLRWKYLFGCLSPAVCIQFCLISERRVCRGGQIVQLALLCLLLDDITEVFIPHGPLGLLVFMKTVTMPLNIVSSSLAGIHADSHEHTHPSCSYREWEGTGRSISALTLTL